MTKTQEARLQITVEFFVENKKVSRNKINDSLIFVFINAYVFFVEYIDAFFDKNCKGDLDSPAGC